MGAIPSQQEEVYELKAREEEQFVSMGRSVNDVTENKTILDLMRR